jgi:hypothetical protein
VTAPTTVVTATFGGAATAITADTVAVDITRGKTGQVFEDIDAGGGIVRLNNEDRAYDPLYTAGSYYGDLRPGVSTPVTVKTSGITIFAGMLGDIDIDYEVSGRTVATFRVEDDLALLGRQEFDEWTATGSQAAGARLAAVMARSEVNTLGSTSFDTGVSTLQGDLVSWGSNVLNYCQLVSRSDLGYFYVSRTGVVTFKDRHATVNGEYVVGFSDGRAVSAYTSLEELLTETGEMLLTEDEEPIVTEEAAAVSTIPYHAIATQVGSDLFYNRVSVDREGGTEQTATNAANGAADGFRSLSLSGLLQSTDTQALDMAQYLLSLYEEPETRVKSILVKLEGLSTTEQDQVLTLDISSLVSVTFKPNNVGDAIDALCVVVGVQHSIGPAFHHVTLHLSDVSRQAVFILDDPVFGRLDSNALAF